MNTAVWTPKHPKESRMWQFMRFVGEQYQQDMTNYQQLHAWSVHQPELFWSSLCDFFNIRFDTPATQILSTYHQMMDAQWFNGATFNFAQKLLSQEDDHTALVSIDERGNRLVLSYRELKHQVSLCAAGLKYAGIVTGDRVGAVLPNVHYAIIAMLATVSIGAIWASCSPDFGAQAVVDRLHQISPKLLFVCDGHTYQGKIHLASTNIQYMMSKMPTVTQVVLCPIINDPSNVHTNPHTTIWDDFQKPATHLEFTSLPFAHPIYILFSSGTTGQPKCIIHGAGGTLLQHIKELGLHTDLSTKDNFFFYTTCGWMMWNWMVSGLALGATLTLYDGSPTYPDMSRLFHLLDQEQITLFGTSAKFLSSVATSGFRPNRSFTMNTLRCILSTGSPLLPKEYDFVYQHLKSDVQLSSISGGTDIISCFALGNPMLPVYRGELQCLGLGLSVDVFNEQGQSVCQTRGELVCTKPFPSMPVGFWNDPNRTLYQQAYFEHFPGVWAHGDFAERTERDGLIIYGRSDATLNPGGVRIGTAEIYRQVEQIPEVVDSVVIGQDWQGDIRIVLFVKLQEGLLLTDALQDLIRKTIRHNASPRHVPAKILQVPDIPHTINGKIVEIAVRQTVHGQTINNFGSIANPEALSDFKNRKELQT